MTNTSSADGIRLSFVTCVSDVAVLSRCLLASPCLARGGLPMQAFFHARSAADAFNSALAAAQDGTWLVWVHQDVLLPLGWDTQFRHALVEAQHFFPHLAVAGVYGLRGQGAGAQRAGHVLDRGHLLREPAALPCLADSLDELLFAVRVGSGLQLDPALGFDFYATDLVLQAQAAGLPCVVVDAYCEHWSNTPSGSMIPAGMAQRIRASGEAFEAKWAARLPVQTSWLTVQQPGDVARFIDQFEVY